MTTITTDRITGLLTEAAETKKTKKLWRWTWRKEGNNIGFLRLCGKTEITLDPKYGEDYVDLHLTPDELRQLARDLAELADTVDVLPPQSCPD